MESVKKMGAKIFKTFKQYYEEYEQEQDDLKNEAPTTSAKTKPIPTPRKSLANARPLSVTSVMSRSSPDSAMLDTKPAKPEKKKKDKKKGKQATAEQTEAAQKMLQQQQLQQQMQQQMQEQLQQSLMGDGSDNSQVCVMMWKHEHTPASLVSSCDNMGKHQEVLCHGVLTWTNPSSQSHVMMW